MGRSRRIEEAVAKNRRKARRLESFEVVVDDQPSRDYSFDGSVVEVDVTAEVYTRPLNGTLVFGHPDAENGFSRGAFGDGRGSWSLAESVSADAGEFTRGGRATVADALEGALEGLETVAVGTGTSTATTGDTALDSRQGSTEAWADKTAATETRGVGAFLFAGFGDTISEVGIEDTSGRLMTRLTTTGVNPSSQQEARVDITMSFSGDGVAEAVITSTGEEAIADSVKSYNEQVGLAEIGIGTGTTTPSKSDTGLESGVSTKTCGRERLTDTVRAYMTWFESEPATQPHDISEMVVFDNSGRAVFRVVFTPFEKNDKFEFTTGASIQVI